MDDDSRALRHRCRAWAASAALLLAASGVVRAQTGDGIELSVGPGTSPGEVRLIWTGSGSSFDVYRWTFPATVLEPIHRQGMTPSLQWTELPPDAPIQFYEVLQTPPNRVAVGPLQPYVFLVMDTSGSMTSPTGVGPPRCAGANDTRLDHVKCATNRLAGDHGEVALGLGRFRLTTTGSCPACTVNGIDCTACDPSTGAGCSTAMSSDARLEVLVPLLDTDNSDVALWNNFTCGTCGTDIAQDPEMAAGGGGPIAGSLRGVQRYLQGLQSTDGTILWGASQPGFDPIRNDPLANQFLAMGRQCRPYVVVSLSDGDESCTTFSNTTAAASSLLSTSVNGNTYRIETRAVGFGKLPGDAQTEAIAHAGGSADVAGVNEGFYPGDDEELTETFRRVAVDAARFERCNNLDDDCDGLADEDFPSLTQPCSDSGVGVCRGTGISVCRPDSTGTECQIMNPGGTPSAEVCNGLDDDCDGGVDEGCGSCVQSEICGNSVDDNCNGRIDEDCTSCVAWADVGGGLEMMQYEASRSDATAGSVGSRDGAPCSQPGVQPWTDLTQPQAAAACSAIGARLCSEQEWQRACAVGAPTAYPVVEPVAGFGDIYIEAESFLASTPATTPADGVTRSWAPDYTAGFSGISALRATPDTGATVLPANAPTQSPRLDFSVSFSQVGNHFVWVKMYAANAAGNTVGVGMSTTPGSAAPTQTLSPSTLNTWQWRRTAALNVTSTGPRFVSLYMLEDGMKVDQIAVTRNASLTPPTQMTGDFGHWAFSTNADTYFGNTCNGNDLDTDTVTPGDQDEVIAAGSVPGGDCYANHGTGRHLFDLSGNVREWVAARIPNINPMLGGSSASGAEGISCIAAAIGDNGFFAPNVGFRCCR